MPIQSCPSVSDKFFTDDNPEEATQRRSRASQLAELCTALRGDLAVLPAGHPGRPIRERLLAEYQSKLIGILALVMERPLAERLVRGG